MQASLQQFLDKPINSGSCVYVDMPIPLNEFHYRSCISKISKTISDAAGVFSIYQIGDISDCGISDIDLIVIFEDKLEVFNFSYKKLFNDLDRYLFMHNIFGASQKIFMHKEFLPPIKRLRRIAGHDVHFINTLSEQTKRRLQEFYALEYIQYFLINIINQFAINQIRVRNLLCSLKALFFDLELLAESHLVNDIKTLYEDLLGLRKNWWGIKDNLSLFHELCKRTIFLTLEVLNVCKYATHRPGRIHDSQLNIRSGVNGYVSSAKSPKNYNVDVYIKQIKLISYLLKLSKTIPHKKMRKQVLDACIALTSIQLILPKPLFYYFEELFSPHYEKVLIKRNLLLTSYHRYISNLSPEFSCFSLFDSYRVIGIKWKYFRFFNHLIFQ